MLRPDLTFVLHMVDWFKISCLGIGFSLVLFPLNNVFHSARPLQTASSIASQSFQVYSNVERERKRILSGTFSIQKITGMLSSNHHLSLYTYDSTQ